MVDWNHRSFREMETSTGTEVDHHESIFGAPLSDQTARDNSTYRTANSGYNTSTTGGYDATNRGYNPNGRYPQVGTDGTVTGNGTASQSAGRLPYNSLPTDNSGPSSSQPSPQAQGGDGVIRSRSPYGIPAPGAISATAPDAQNPNQQRPQDTGVITGRSPYGIPAPGAIAATAPDNQSGQQGQNGQQRTGDNGVITGRSPYGIPAPGAISATAPENQGQQPPVVQPGRPVYGTPVPPGLFPNDNNTGPGSPTNPGNTTGPWRPAPDQLPGAQQSTQPGVGNYQGQPGRDSGTGLASGQQVNQQTRDIINASLHQELSYSNYMGWSIIGGVAGSGPIPYLLDKAGAYKHGKFFADHSPLSMQLDDANGIVQRENNVRALSVKEQADAMAGVKTLEQEIATHQPKLDGYVSSTEAGLNSATTKVEEKLFGDKLDMLQRARRGEISLDEVKAAELPKGVDVPADGKYLSAEEATFLREQHGLYEKTAGFAEQGVRATKALEASDSVLKAAGEKVAALEGGASEFKFLGGKSLPFTGGKKVPFADVQLPEGAPVPEMPWKPQLASDANGFEKAVGGWRGDKWSNSIGEGLAVGAVALAGDYAVDKFAPNILGLVGGHDQRTFSKRDYYLEMPALAAAMILPKNTMSKIGWTATTVAVNGLMNWGGNLLPGALGQGPPGEYSKLMAPNWVDSFGMAAAWMMPAKSPMARLGAVGGAWALGRGADFLNNVVGVPVPFMGKMDLAAGYNDDLKAAVANDRPTSHSSFEDIVSKGKRLGMENEAAIGLITNDFMNQHSKDANPLEYWHGTAALSTAEGDFWVERGTKIEPSQHNDKGRMLAGRGLDMGGFGLEAYRTAAGDLINAQNRAIKDKLPGDQVDELKKSTKAVEDRINAIYGPHDIQGCFNDLKTEFRQNIGPMSHYQVALKQQVDNLHTKDPRYIGKMVRDLVLLDLSIASYQAEHGDGGSAQIMFTESQRYIKAAEQFDPKAPDLVELQKISAELAKTVPVANAAQYQSGAKNPFSVQQPRN